MLWIHNLCCQYAYVIYTQFYTIEQCYNYLLWECKLQSLKSLLWLINFFKLMMYSCFVKFFHSASVTSWGTQGTLLIHPGVMYCSPSGYRHQTLLSNSCWIFLCLNSHQFYTTLREQETMFCWVFLANNNATNVKECTEVSKQLECINMNLSDLF